MRSTQSIVRLNLFFLSFRTAYESKYVCKKKEEEEEEGHRANEEFLRDVFCGIVIVIIPCWTLCE